LILRRKQLILKKHTWFEKKTVALENWMDLILREVKLILRRMQLISRIMSWILWRMSWLCEEEVDFEKKTIDFAKKDFYFKRTLLILGPSGFLEEWSYFCRFWSRLWGKIS
jgi:hypothetical protein